MLRHLELAFIKLHILYHACKEEIYGAGMMEELGRHGYKTGPGLLYPTLAKMEKEGLLISRKQVVDRKQRKYYRATAGGKDLLEEMKKKIVELYGEVIKEKMSYLAVGFAAVFVSGLTMFSGFGLGTLLMPVFAIFFPVETAVAATAVVHGANSIFKIIAVGRHADRTLVLMFGLPAIVSAFAGASLLIFISGFPELLRYEIGSVQAEVTPVKLVLAALMILFALFELLPALKKISFDRKYLLVGGLLSGFFGGLSGHQGALRSAFLAKVGVSAQAFVGTNAMIGFIVDMTRITAYGLILFGRGTPDPVDGDMWGLIATGVAAAFIGVRIGKRCLDKITMTAIQNLTGVLLLGIAIFLGAGII